MHKVFGLQLELYNLCRRVELEINGTVDGGVLLGRPCLTDETRDRYGMVAANTLHDLEGIFGQDVK